MTTAARFEAMAMQSLLPGLTFAAEKAIEMLNQTRAVLGLAPLSLQAEGGGGYRRMGRPRKYVPEPVAEEAPENISPPRRSRRQSGGRKPWTAAQKKEIGERTRVRWALVHEAGIKPKRGSPSRADIERALKIIERKKKSAVAVRKAVRAVRPAAKNPVAQAA